MCVAPGDSLRRKIDEGLAHSRFGILVLSQAFIRKPWPQWELDGLISREVGSGKTIIPVWHGINSDDVRRYSPSLADRVAVKSNGGPRDAAIAILRAFHFERLRYGRPPRVTRGDGTDLVVLPITPLDGIALCLGATPVTNAQYRRHSGAPTGKELVDGGWSGPFRPWDAPNFGESEKPVVCVSLHDALKYCSSLGAFIPTAAMWRCAAHRGLGNHPDWSVISDKLHHRSTYPASVNSTSPRSDN
jgi:hypothetical protein